MKFEKQHASTKPHVGTGHKISYIALKKVAKFFKLCKSFSNWKRFMQVWVSFFCYHSTLDKGNWKVGDKSGSFFWWLIVNSFIVTRKDVTLKYNMVDRLLFTSINSYCISIFSFTYLQKYTSMQPVNLHVDSGSGSWNFLKSMDAIINLGSMKKLHILPI